MPVLTKTIAVLLTAAVSGGAPIASAEEPTSLRRLMNTNLANLTIEELMNESVSSVSKRETKLNESPAAVSVVTQDDLRRLGVTTLPEALRWVPGLDVAQISGNQFAIGSRGFNQQYSNKLLVVMDGRTIYNPAFGGVFWDVQDTALEDIDRIEVIRGPGATLWGANAVNGVINIITKSAKATQGTLVSGLTGSEERGGLTIRHGGKIGNDAYYRVYLKYFNREGALDETGHELPDDADGLRGGFRLDWEPSLQNTLTVQGDYYYNHSGERRDDPLLVAPYVNAVDAEYLQRGANILARWTHTFSETSQLSLQAYYDYFDHGTIGASEQRDTADIELQYRFALGSRHDVTVGAGYRFTSDQTFSSEFLSFDPAEADKHLFTGFVQDQIALVPKKLSLILGTKVEHNDYTGVEVQPGARLLWTPSERHTVWASASRAVRTPTRVDADVRYQIAAAPPGPLAPPIKQTFLGTPGLPSEELWAYELGYRVQPTHQLSLDLALFYNHYDGVMTFAPSTPVFRPNGGSPYVDVPLLNGNYIGGDTYGAELSVQWKITDRWRIAADYSWLQMHVRPSLDATGSSPQQQVRLRSYLQLPWDLELNAAVAYVDELPYQQVPAYVRADLGLVWRPGAAWEIGIWGKNLLDDRHAEFATVDGLHRYEVPRSVLLKATWNF